MLNNDVLAWQTLRRPPLPDDVPPSIPNVPLKALACRNSVTSLTMLVTAKEPARKASITFTDLTCECERIPADAISVYLVGAVPVPEVGMVCDPLLPVKDFEIGKSAALYINVRIPKAIPSGTYHGAVMLQVEGRPLAQRSIEVEIANVDLPDVRDWRFFLNVWMNPGAVARYHDLELWSDEHFKRLKPYVEDLAAHGQKTVVVPLASEPRIDQTDTAYPSAIKWVRRDDKYEFDFSIFDRYVELHEECGINRAIHCYSVAKGLGGVDSVINYLDARTGEQKELKMSIGDSDFTETWGSFFVAFRSHLIERGWMSKTFIGFDETPSEAIEKLVSFLKEHAPEFKTSLTTEPSSVPMEELGDLSLATGFDERGIAENAPSDRNALGLMELLDPDSSDAICSGGRSFKSASKEKLTTYHLCSEPEHPNMFMHSPLIESRMLGFLAIQGGYDGFLRRAYNDWPEYPYENPKWEDQPSGDAFLVYPGTHGPVSSLRWEQLREAIQDYELAMLASENMQSSEEMVDYEQAISLACRSVNGAKKSTGDIEIARRLLIPIAQHQNE